MLARMWGENIYSLLAGLQTAVSAVKTCVKVPRKTGERPAVRSSFGTVVSAQLRRISFAVPECFSFVRSLLSIIGLSACATGVLCRKDSTSYFRDAFSFLLYLQSTEMETA